MLTLLVSFFIYRLSSRATVHLLMGLTLALATAHFACEHYMDAATGAHLDHTITLFVGASGRVICSPFEYAQCRSIVEWLLTPVRLALKPLMFWSFALAEYMIGA